MSSFQHGEPLFPEKSRESNPRQSQKKHSLWFNYQFSRGLNGFIIISSEIFYCEDFCPGLVDSKGQSLDDEYMEDNYGAPLNMVCWRLINIRAQFQQWSSDLHIFSNIWNWSFQVRITHWYVKRYCTENHVSKFVFYFPYILLIVPLTLVLVDRIFIK